MPLYNKGEEGALYAAGSADECTNYLGRACEANTLVNSGNFSSRNGETALETVKSVPSFVDYTLESTETSSSQQQQTTTQASGSGDQSQQEVQQYTPGTATPSTKTSQSSIQASDVESVWAETISNFGVGQIN
ncbi:hypothetical protein PRNP1_003032 [Phytophthora ramorum]|nr:hypothetical protein KRP23_446 [Phytophthora ramorum]